MRSNLNDGQRCHASRHPWRCAAAARYSNHAISEPSSACCIPATSASTGPPLHDSSVSIRTPPGTGVNAHEWMPVMPSLGPPHNVCRSGSTWYTVDSMRRLYVRQEKTAPAANGPSRCASSIAFCQLGHASMSVCSRHTRLGGAAIVVLCRAITGASVSMPSGYMAPPGQLRRARVGLLELPLVLRANLHELLRRGHPGLMRRHGLHGRRLAEVLEELLEAAGCDDTETPHPLGRDEEGVVGVRRDPQCAAGSRPVHRL